MEEEKDKGSSMAKLMQNKWAKITALGMAGLLIVVWYVSVVAKP